MDPKSDIIFETQKAFWDKWVALAHQPTPVMPFDEWWGVTLLEWHRTMFEHQVEINKAIMSAWCQISYSLNPFLTMTNGTQPTSFMTLQDIVSRAWTSPFDLSQPYESASEADASSNRRSSKAADHSPDSSERAG